MKKQGIVRSLLVTAAYAATSMMVLACASQQDMSAEEEMMMQGQVASSASTESEAAASTESASNKEATQELPAEAETAEAGSRESGAVDTAFAPTGLDAGTPEVPATAEVAAADTSEGTASTEVAAVDSTTSAAPSAELTSTATEPTLVSPEPSLDVPQTSVTIDDATLGTAEQKPAKKAKSRRKVARKPAIAPVLHAPVVPGEAFNKDGVTFNRYYFLRSGDHAEKVSKKLFGNPDRAKDLLAWNGGASKWNPGETIFYPSPVKPQDTQMASFYQEASIPAQKYTVNDGETLPKIAKQIYGDTRSWKEIANANGMRVVESIQPGAELTIWPANLDGYSTTVQASNSLVPEVKPTDIKTDANGTQAATSVVTSNSPANKPAAPPLMPEGNTVEKLPIENLEPSAALADPDEAPVAKPSTEAGKSLASMDVGKFFVQNLFLILTGLVAVVVLIFMIRRARNSREPVDF